MHHRKKNQSTLSQLLITIHGASFYLLITPEPLHVIKAEIYLNRENANVKCLFTSKTKLIIRSKNRFCNKII